MKKTLLISASIFLLLQSACSNNIDYSSKDSSEGREFYKNETKVAVWYLEADIVKKTGEIITGTVKTFFEDNNKNECYRIEKYVKNVSLDGKYK